MSPLQQDSVCRIISYQMSRDEANLGDKFFNRVGEDLDLSLKHVRSQQDKLCPLPERFAALCQKGLPG